VDRFRNLFGQPAPAIIQDPLYYRHPLGRPQPAGSQLHGADSEESLHLRPARTILEENHHSFLIVEHRASERARDMAGSVAQALKQASREATILLYAPVLDRHLDAMAEVANQLFCFYNMQSGGIKLSTCQSLESEAFLPICQEE